MIKFAKSVKHDKATILDKVATFFASKQIPQNERQNLCIKVGANFAFHAVIAQIVFCDFVGEHLRITTKHKFVFVKTVFEKLVVMSENFSPNLLNILVGQTFDVLTGLVMANNNGIATVAGHVGETHFIIGSNKENAMTRNGGGASVVSLSASVLSRINKSFGVNVFFHSRHFLDFNAP